MLNIENKNFYELLGLERRATAEQIREAYRDIARVFHPDSNFYDEIAELELSDQHNEVYKRLTDAYNTLVNPERRRAYDKALPPELRSWGDEEEIEIEIDLSRSKGRTPRQRKLSGSYAMGRFGTGADGVNVVFDGTRSATVVARAVPVAHVMKHEREKQDDWRLVKLSLTFSALVVVLTAVVLSVA